MGFKASEVVAVTLAGTCAGACQNLDVHISEPMQHFKQVQLQLPQVLAGFGMGGTCSC